MLGWCLDGDKVKDAVVGKSSSPDTGPPDTASSQHCELEPVTLSHFTSAAVSVRGGW